MFNFSNCLSKSAAKVQKNHNSCKKMQKKMYKYMNFAKSRLQNRTKYPLTYKKTATEVTVFCIQTPYWQKLITGV
jgi:hypothetical protein